MDLSGTIHLDVLSLGHRQPPRACQHEREMYSHLATDNRPPWARQLAAARLASGSQCEVLFEGLVREGIFVIFFLEAKITLKYLENFEKFNDFFQKISLKFQTVIRKVLRQNQYILAPKWLISHDFSKKKKKKGVFLLLKCKIWVGCTHETWFVCLFLWPFRARFYLYYKKFCDNTIQEYFLYV